MEKREFRWDAADYARNSSAQMGWAKELISRLSLKGDESLLDLGCGDGKISAGLARLLPEGRVLGIDLSEEMIALASETFPRDEFPNLSFERMDVTEIRLSDSFDVVFSNAVLHWVKDHARVLAGVRSCIKPGGTLLFQMGGRGNALAVFRVMEELIRSERWQPFFENFIPPYYFYGPEEYETWLEKSGFRPVRLRLFPKEMRHEGREGLRGWLRTTWFPYTDQLPEKMRDSFLDEVVETYIKNNPLDSQGRTLVPMVRLEVEAVAI